MKINMAGGNKNTGSRGKAYVGKGSVVTRPTSQKNSTNTGQSAPKLSQEGRKFWCALSDPFCREAMGAKLPDEFTFPTEPVTYRAKFVLTPVANDYFVVYPHAMFSIAGFNAVSASAPSVASASGITGTLQVGSQVGFINNVNYGAATSPQAFSIPYQRGRLVGWGLRVKNVTSAKDVAGEIQVAVLPAGERLPFCFSNALNVDIKTPGASTPSQADAIANDIAFSSGIPSSGTGITSGTYGHPLLNSLDGMPTVDTFTAAELAESGGICITPKINSPAAYRFNGTALNQDARIGAPGYPYATTQGGTNAGLTATLIDLLSYSGHNSVILQPINHGADVNRYEVEVVYHYEMIPDGNRINASALVTPSPLGKPGELDRVVRSSLLTPLYQFVRHEGQTVYNNFKQALPGLMSKAAMSALMMV